MILKKKKIESRIYGTKNKTKLEELEKLNALKLEIEKELEIKRKELKKQKSIRNLDKYEGYPMFYSKKYIPITINNKEYSALIYIMNEQYEYALPSQTYIDICKEGYNNFGFDKKILEKALDDTTDNLTNPKILK